MLENALYVQVFVPFHNFIKREEFAGILLLIFTLIALVWANSPWDDLYIDLQQMDVAVQIGTVAVSQTVIHWINDGLMAIFFPLSVWRSNGKYWQARSLLSSRHPFRLPQLLEE